MGRKDQQSKLFFEKNERFADLMNGIVYNGKQVLKPYELEEMNIEQITELKQKTSVQRNRDLLKRCRKNGTVYAMFGIEAQSSVDECMPLRMMEYDALTYLKMQKEEKKIYPVVSVCLYTGESRWNKPASLHEMMEIPEELKGFVDNHHAHIIDAKNLNPDNYENEEVREFLQLYQDMHKLSKEEWEQKYTGYSASSADALETAAILSGNLKMKSLIEMKEEKRMCKNFDHIISEWKKEGFVQGVEQGIEQGLELERIETIKALNQMKAGMAMICAATRLSADEVNKLMKIHEIELVS